MNDFYLYRSAWISAPHYDKRLTDGQCDELLKKGGWLVRNTYDFDQKQPTDFWYIIKDSFGGMEELSSNERNKIRRAFNTFVFRRVDNIYIKNNAYPIVNAIYKDYAIHDRPMSEKVFLQVVDDWRQREYDYWGLFAKKNNEFVGFAAVQLFENACFYDMVAVHPKYKHNATYPYYGFFYKLNEYYLAEERFHYVTDGSRSITEHSNIQPFLEQEFNFRKAYCKLKIRYKWWFGIIVRMLYPFRNIIPNRSVQAVLKMHGMQSK